MSEETKKLMDMKYNDLWKKYRNLVNEYGKLCEELKSRIKMKELDLSEEIDKPIPCYKLYYKIDDYLNDNSNDGSIKEILIVKLDEKEGE